MEPVVLQNMSAFPAKQVDDRKAECMDSLDTMRPPCRLSIFRLTTASGLQYKKIAAM